MESGVSRGSIRSYEDIEAFQRAEGYAKRRSARDFKSHLSNALGSVNEMIVHLQMAEELGYVEGDVCNELIGHYRIVGKQLAKLIERWQEF